MKQPWTQDKDSGMIYKLGPGTGKVRQNRNFAWMKTLKSSLPETAHKPITFVMDKYIEKIAQNLVLSKKYYLILER